MRRALTAALCLSLAAQGARACEADAMVVFDASASMNSQGFDGTTTRRIDEARAAVGDVLPLVEHTRRIGLVTYGPGGGACDGISLRFSPMASAAARLIAEVRAVRPSGRTPLTEAVRQAASGLGAGPGIVVLVTDGEESCNGAPCALADALPENITVHVIGFKLDWTAFARHGMRPSRDPAPDILAGCLAVRTGGQVASTTSAAELAAALQTSLGCLVLGQTEPDDAVRGPRT